VPSPVTSRCLVLAGRQRFPLAGGRDGWKRWRQVPTRMQFSIDRAGRVDEFWVRGIAMNASARDAFHRHRLVAPLSALWERCHPHALDAADALPVRDGGR